MVRWGERVGARMRIADTRVEPPGLDELLERHPRVVARTGDWHGSDLDAWFRDAEFIVASPGVAIAGPACHPAVARARAAGQEIIGDVELFSRLLSQIKGKKPDVIGITGSNGKSTVTEMAGAMCRAAGRKTVEAGNIGLPVLDALAEAEASGMPDVYVLELSSFQLETTSSLVLDAAAMLNLSQDHLDRYANMADYAAAKQRIFLHARHQVLNGDDPASMAMRVAGRACSVFGFSAASDYRLDRQSNALCERHDPFIGIEELPVTGHHNALNALAAFALCRATGLPAEPLVDGLRHFRGLPHRTQHVGRIHGVDFYDDSKGTNVGSTVAALNGMTQPVVLIAGGQGKEQDFSVLAGPVQRRATAVVLIGKDARLIESALALASARVPCLHATSMEAAVQTAFAHASPGSAVLLSPACASFDMFRNYKHRGEVFAQCVEALIEAVKQREAHAV